MLKAFRDNLKYLSWVLWLVIIAFILVAFVGLGDLGPGGGASADVAVTVGGKTVSFREFEGAYRRMEDFYRQTYGERFNADFARQLGLHQQVLDTLVADRILLLEADRLELEVTDGQLQNEILNLPVFLAADGAFVGAQDYARILRQSGHTVDSFEAGMRQDLLLDKVRNLVTRNVYVSDSEIEEDYRQRIERAKIRFFKAPYSTLAGEVIFDDADLESYYQAHQDSFETPERRIAEYLVVDVKRVRNSLAVAPDEVQAYYDGHPDEFDQPEQVRARHILLQVNAERSAEEARRLLQEAKQRVASGEDFAALAAELSEDPGSKTSGGDLGFFGRGAMVEAFETAAFSTPAGQMTEPVETDFGFHLIEVLEHNPGGVRPFDEVEAGIRQRLLVERSSEAAERKIDQLLQQLASSELDLAAIAETDDTVTFQATPAFAVDENVPSIGRSTLFASTAFELELGALSEPVRVTRGWALLRVAEIHQPRIPALDQVRTEAEGRLRTELVRKAALDRLTRDRDAGVDALAGAIDAKVEESESFGADGPGGTLGSNSEIARAALAADQGDVVGPIATESGAVVFEVLERVKVNPEEYAQQKVATRATLAQRRGAQLVAALIAQRRRELDISFDPQLLATFDLDLAGLGSS
ncbi:MAG: peptidyl-prolyl cis-trans isomerase [Acidobacteria bacterium]|nr:peptidyl-prolyl cis-trans isomerase [Acidobacteriota bacterium]